MELEIRILRAVADGYRTTIALKRILRKDVRTQVKRLEGDSLRVDAQRGLILNKRGAGRLRFAS